VPDASAANRSDESQVADIDAQDWDVGTAEPVSRLQQGAVASAGDNEVGVAAWQTAQTTIDIFMWRKGVDPLLFDAFAVENCFECVSSRAGVRFGAVDGDDDLADSHRCGERIGGSATGKRQRKKLGKEKRLDIVYVIHYMNDASKAKAMMTPQQLVRASKFLSLVLRHEPGKVGLGLDAAGWADVQGLLDALKEHGLALTLEQLKQIVNTSDKKRFAFSEDGLRIRASQGHSVEVDLQYAPQHPPKLLYHGTAERFLGAIRAKGLSKMGRHHVHLSAEPRLTMEVGARHGKPVLLIIEAQAMAEAGYTFYLSANGVWLVDHVPIDFIQFPEEGAVSL
jgi:putative RNA 2'-phosphotransferase